MLQVALQLPFSALFYQVANQFITSAMYEPPMMMPTRMNTMSLQSIQSTQVTISSRYLTATANISSLLYCWYVSAQLHQRIVQGYQFPIVSPTCSTYTYQISSLHGQLSSWQTSQLQSVIIYSNYCIYSSSLDDLSYWLKNFSAVFLSIFNQGSLRAIKSSHGATICSY